MGNLTHNYPHLSKFLAHTLLEAEQTRVGTDTEEDVWNEIRCSTLRETPPETTLFVGLYGDHHPACGEPFIDQRKHEIREHLEEDEVNLERVSFFHHTERAIKRLVPAQEAHEYTFIDHAVPLSEIATTPGHYKLFERHGGWERHTTTKVEAKAAHVKEKKVLPLLHLGNAHNLQLLVAAVKGWNSTKSFLKYLQEPDGDAPAPIKTLVIFEPNEDDGDLKCLPEFREQCPEVDVVIFHRPCEKWGVTLEGDGVEWRNSTKTILELSEEKAVMHIEGLLPEKSLTMVTGPAFTGKTYQALEMALVLATGESTYLGHFKGPIKPLPVIYHVPELQEKIVGDYLRRLEASDRLKGCEEMLLIRTLEHDLWQLDSPQMIDSSRGRYIFLDTCGYFNDGDDSASYGQAIEFAKKINTLIREGCLGVCGVYHPPKYSKSKKETGNMMTLENQILGSAGYGGVLRSCIGMRNLHDDPAKGLWVYCQQLKVHGLQPFQVEGVPVKLIKKPGESLYLSELLKGNGSKREQAVAMMKEGKTREEIRKALGVSPRDLTKWKQEEVEFDSNSEENNNE